MRLIDADAIIEVMKKCAENPKNELALRCYWYTQRILEEAPTVEPASPWHKVEKPPKSGQECFTAYRSILRSDPEWLYDICYYTDDLARDCPLMYGAEHRPGWYQCVSEYGDVECHPKYWMPIEPPKEDEHGN